MMEAGIDTGDFYDSYIDVSDRVEVYNSGKVFKCDCGQKLGLEHETPSEVCPSCGELLVDEMWEDREEQAEDEDNDQTSLDNFM